MCTFSATKFYFPGNWSKWRVANLKICKLSSQKMKIIFDFTIAKRYFLLHWRFTNDHLRFFFQKRKNTFSTSSGCEEVENGLFLFYFSLVSAEVIKKIDESLNDDASLLSSGKVIKTGYNKELDRLRSISDGGKNILLKIQNEEIEKTGISSLKIAYNKVFGYYLEVTNAHKDKVPSSWIRKQTLVNAERYITEELKEYEEKAHAKNYQIL